MNHSQAVEAIPGKSKKTYHLDLGGATAEKMYSSNQPLEATGGGLHSTGRALRTNCSAESAELVLRHPQYL